MIRPSIEAFANSKRTADIKQGVDTQVNAENEKFFRWLAAASSESNHEAARRKWQLGTGLWLTGNSDYIA